MTFVGKTRLKVEPRRVPISAATVALFKRMVDGKKRDNLLFMRDESIMGASYCELRPDDIAAWRKSIGLSAGARMIGVTWYGRQ
jgi:hypothetical protein